MADVLGGANWRIDVGDSLAVLRTLPSDTFHCAVTSPPYFGLRDYGHANQLGLEKAPFCFGWVHGAPCGECYCCRMVAVFAEVRRVLRPDGTFWLNIGDSYSAVGKSGGGRQGEKWAEVGADFVGPRGGKWRPAPVGTKPKDLLGVPWALAFALRADGWTLRSEIVWHKPAPMPESVKDRPTRGHEQVFLLAKSPRYYYDGEAVAERGSVNSHGGRVHAWRYTAACGVRRDGDRPMDVIAESRNLRTVWKIPPGNFKGCHFAVMPIALAERCIKAGTSAHGVCPSCGAPWVRQVERERRPTRPGRDTKVTVKNNGDLSTAEANGWNHPNVIGNRDPQRHCTTSETIGWAPSCKCLPAPPIGALVLDPFAGAGTSLVAALRLGRRALGVELNPSYVTLARERIVGDNPLFNAASDSS